MFLWCPECRADLPAAAFGSNKSRPNGLDSICREHRNEYTVQWRADRKRMIERRKAGGAAA